MIRRCCLIPMLSTLALLSSLQSCRSTEHKGSSEIASAGALDADAVRLCEAAASDPKATATTTINALIKATASPDCAAMLSKLPTTKHLELAGRSLTDLAPLSRAKSLETLDITQNAVTDLSPLAQLPNLQRLYASSNKLTSLPSPNTWSKLVELNVAANEISDISAVMTMTNLESLDFSLNKVLSIVPLSNLSALRIIFADENRIRDVSALAGNQSLEQLHIARNAVTDLRPLVDLSSLRYVKYLDLRENPISRSGCPIIGESQAVTTFCQNTFVDRN